MINKEKYYIPKDQAESYDGNVIKFRFSEQDLNQFQREPPTIYGEDETLQEQGTSQETETGTETEDEDEETIPLTEERLDVSKKSQESQETITKKPLKETKTVEVPLTRKEVSIERRPPKGGSETEAQNAPVQSPEEEIKIPVRREEAEVTKKPYVKEEVGVKKKKVTDKKKVTEDVTSEELDTSTIER